MRMKRTVRTSLLRAALGSVVLGLTLVIGVSESGYAQQQSSQAPGPSSVTDVNQGPASTPAAPTRVTIETPYTPPSMGGSDIPSNHRGSHGDGNPNS